MHFCPERLIQVRESLHINKAEAARRLNLSAMAYGRYERGEREPSYQYAFYIAYTFHCNLDFLYGQSDEMETDFITITRSDSGLCGEVKSALILFRKTPDKYCYQCYN